LGKALQSGDIGGAQDALKKLGQGLQSSNSTAKAHHHHYDHGGKPPSDAAAFLDGYEQYRRYKQRYQLQQHQP